MPALKEGEPTPLHLQIAAELFPGEPQGFPFLSEDADFQLPAGEEFGVPDVDESELSKEADDIQAETGFGSVIGAAREGEQQRERESCVSDLLAVFYSQQREEGQQLSVFVVLNLPVVPTEKYDKLAAVIKKIYGSIGTIREDRQPSWPFTCLPAHGDLPQGGQQQLQLLAVLSSAGCDQQLRGPWYHARVSCACMPAGGFFLPQDANGKTKGFAFIEFSSPQVGVLEKQLKSRTSPALLYRLAVMPCMKIIFNTMCPKISCTFESRAGSSGRQAADRQVPARQVTRVLCAHAGRYRQVRTHPRYIHASGAQALQGHGKEKGQPAEFACRLFRLGPIGAGSFYSGTLDDGACVSTGNAATT
eukprot:1140783-Pelagomonas_calceolata.AAC.4